MKKIYMTPATRWAEIEETSIIATSGGVDDDGTIGRAYSESDVSYGREVSSKNLWDSEW